MTDNPVHPSDSVEQRDAGSWLVNRLSEQLGVKLEEQELDIDGDLICFDGVNEIHTILCEAWAHVGPLKGAHADKLMSDALKLFYAESRLSGSGFVRKILLFGDPIAARPFTGRGWKGQALRQIGVEVLVLEMPADLREKILAAQKRQKR